MRTFRISDELYEQLKRFIVDPFDDTPEVVIERLIEIVDKARSRWSPFEAYDPPEESPRPAEPFQERPSQPFQERPPQPFQERPSEPFQQRPSQRFQEQPAPPQEEREVIL
ncbi:MAG: hypothetical protein EHM35_16635 [Planctomycetaceae bacterium]|nr:MAG: hypothetical protein EHM35_16635 [Planctomycetaceae bacterium]